MSATAPFHIIGFRPANPICGDMLTRSVIRPVPGKRESNLRWCAQCYAIWEWETDTGWTRRDCAVCGYRSGVAYAFGKIVEGMVCLVDYDAECHGSKIISWKQFAAELLVAGLTTEQFLSGDIELLRDFYRHLQSEYKRQQSQRKAEAA